MGIFTVIIISAIVASVISSVLNKNTVGILNGGLVFFYSLPL